MTQKTETQTESISWIANEKSLATRMADLNGRQINTVPLGHQQTRR